MTENQINKILSKFIDLLQTCTNESAKKETFLTTLIQLFPTKAHIVNELTRGAEKFLKYNTPTPTAVRSTGFADSFFSNIIIEFEYDLKRTGDHAQDQLKEYVAKVWANEKIKSDYICISTDGGTWNIFTPVLKTEQLTSNQISEKDVDLVKNESITLVASDTISFYNWLDRVLFRENSLKPQGKVICAEFGVGSYNYTKSFKGLSDVYSRSAKGMKEVQTAFKNWQQYLQFTYGDISASEELFVAHTFLSGFTKILMASVLASKNKSSLSYTDLDSVLKGDYFYKLNIRNYVEKDFFYWVNFTPLAPALNKIWSDIFNYLMAYDFSKIESDFLKEIYQGLVDPKDRHDLGEHYTPDWLCEKIVIEALDKWNDKKSIPRMADITCGSGSFLRIAIQEIKRRYFGEKNKKQSDALKHILNSVVGFEIHPLAAFIAKTNYMLALEDLIQNADAPVTIPIFLCDSLLNAEQDQLNLLERDTFLLKFADQEFIFPKNKAMTDDRFDNLIDFIDYNIHSIKNEPFLEQNFKSAIKSEIDKIAADESSQHQELIKSFTKLASALHSKVIKNENTIWSFVLKNNFRPVTFSKAIDIVVGNPPWLSFRYIKNEKYRKELENIGLRRHKIAPQNGKLRTQMELGTIFLTHAVESYLVDGGMIYFVLPRSIFSADHHSNLRELKYTLNMRIEEIWDLYNVSPVFKIPSAVIIASSNSKTNKIQFSGRELKAKLPSADLSLKVAEKFLKESKKTLHLVKMGSRNAFSFDKKTITATDNYYMKQFKQGATILPRNYYFIDLANTSKSKKVVPASTSTSIKKNAKPPYKSVNMTGNVDSNLIFATLIAENIIPYAVLAPFKIHLPLIHKNKKWTYINSKGLSLEGYRDSATWFQKVEKSFDEISSGKMTLFERLNYHNELISQDPSKKYWILYCTSGKNVCASVYNNSSRTWIDHTLYWHTPASGKNEAYYLAAILNAQSMNELIKPFQSKGLLGERHVHKKILELGIPKFDKKNNKMLQLSKLSETLSKKVEKNASKFNSKSTGKKRNQVREYFKTDFEQIDKLVIALFK